MGDIHEAITLLKCGALLDVQDKLGRTALFHAAEGGGKEMVHFLLEAGADKLIENNAGLNPAQQAMLNNPPWPGTASLLQVFRFPHRPLPELLNFWQEISMDENLLLDQQTAEEEEDEKDEEDEEDGNQKKSAIARFLGFG
eukprot:FR740490.1.p1 GENE.FR740490.1~~FR740490.1.p1  ORF type:complete len:153 (+),score=33.52 FR740490.1:39-461(+)